MERLYFIPNFDILCIDLKIPKFGAEVQIEISCYAPKFYNPKMVKSCGVGILPALIIQIKCTTA
jgi:hypothetical protein